MGAGEDRGLGGPAQRHCCDTAVPRQQKGPLPGVQYQGLLIGKHPPLQTPNILLLSDFTCLLMESEPALSLGLFFTISSKQLIAAVEIYCVLASTQSQPLLAVYFSLLMHCTQQPQSI